MTLISRWRCTVAPLTFALVAISWAAIAHAQRVVPTELSRSADVDGVVTAVAVVPRSAASPRHLSLVQGHISRGADVCDRGWKTQILQGAAFGVAGGWLTYQFVSLLFQGKSASLRSRLMIGGAAFGAIYGTVRCLDFFRDWPPPDSEVPPQPDPSPQPVPVLPPRRDTLAIAPLRVWRQSH